MLNLKAFPMVTRLAKRMCDRGLNCKYNHQLGAEAYVYFKSLKFFTKKEKKSIKLYSRSAPSSFMIVHMKGQAKPMMATVVFCNNSMVFRPPFYVASGRPFYCLFCTFFSGFYLFLYFINGFDSV